MYTTVCARAGAASQDVGVYATWGTTEGAPALSWAGTAGATAGCIEWRVLMGAAGSSGAAAKLEGGSRRGPT